MSYKNPDDPPSVRWFKKRAKALPSDEKHGAKLCSLAQAAGFPSWKTLLEATEEARSAAIDRLKDAEAIWR